MKIRYYYNRDEHNRPVETICLLSDKGTITKGIAICNLDLDSISKKLGRKIARGRAMKAMKMGYNLHHANTKSKFIRAYYNPALTEFEKRLI